MMMIRSVFCLFLLLTATEFSFSQDQITTFILVRHAEKGSDGTNDPDLRPEGLERAKRLAEMLTKTSVDAVYSTSFKRTRNTVVPLAAQKGLEVLSYDGRKPEEVETILEKHAGKTIVISGHSNNIPAIANLLLGKKQVKDFEDNDYKNMLILSVVKKGKVATLTWLTY